MTVAQLIKTSGETTEVAPVSSSGGFCLSELYAMIGGPIDVVHLREGRRMIVHDEGILIPLPVNAKACTLYGGPIHGDVVVGNAREIQ